MSEVALEQRRIVYDDQVVRWFVWASVIFGIVGLSVGALIAAQLAFWKLNFGTPYLTFSRLRPLHTNAVIFALVGNMMFAGIYYSAQRLLKTRLASDLLSRIHFWGWQIIILAAAVSLPLGFTQGKEYAELEWPIDLAITVIWIVFAVNFFWTLAKRNEKNLYVAIWFYIGTIVTVAVLHVVNALALPISPFKSYSVYAGVQDALVQWWYGHNAVAFFLTTPILGIMYYFLPKAAERPVYSYRLSIIHFWSLVFMYIWAGPHHLLYTALPEWAQSLGMVFSLALWAPSWGGMLNGLLTLRGAWDKVRADPVLKFFVAGVTFYGMATFEGPLLSIKSVSALGHYTDWIIGHVHGGALGWNGFMAAGMFYWLMPRLFGTQLHSKKAADTHFWLGTAGIILYMVAMWVSGISQGLMWRAVKPDGALLYPDFVETLVAIRPLYIVRLVGGLLYLAGFVLMAWNLWKTVQGKKPVETEVTVVVEAREKTGGWGLVFGRPVVLSAAAMAFLVGLGLGGLGVAAVCLVGVGAVAIVAYVWDNRVAGRPTWHGLVEGKPLVFTVLTLVAVLIGGVAELVPTIFARSAVPKTGPEQALYTALEVEGRDIYVREGCYTCHSQMVRPFQSEKLRYGDPSRAEEFIYDRPFQWGSKRTGPDLHRVGGKYSDLWHYTHLVDPRATSVESNMPSFAYLVDRRVDTTMTTRKLRALQSLGAPYTEGQVAAAAGDVEAQGNRIAEGLAKDVKVRGDSEIVALVAYLQKLGKNVESDNAAPVAEGR